MILSSPLVPRAGASNDVSRAHSTSREAFARGLASPQTIPKRLLRLPSPLTLEEARASAAVVSLRGGGGKKKRKQRARRLLMMREDRMRAALPVRVAPCGLTTECPTPVVPSGLAKIFVEVALEDDRDDRHAIQLRYASNASATGMLINAEEDAVRGCQRLSESSSSSASTLEEDLASYDVVKRTECANDTFLAEWWASEAAPFTSTTEASATVCVIA